jgi:hypothetical protein
MLQTITLTARRRAFSRRAHTFSAPANASPVMPTQVGIYRFPPSRK